MENGISQATQILHTYGLPLLWNVLGALAIWIIGGWAITAIRNLIKKSMAARNLDPTLATTSTPASACYSKLCWLSRYLARWAWRQLIRRDSRRGWRRHRYGVVGFAGKFRRRRIFDFVASVQSGRRHFRGRRHRRSERDRHVRDDRPHWRQREGEWSATTKFSPTTLSTIRPTLIAASICVARLLTASIRKTPSSG